MPDQNEVEEFVIIPSAEAAYTAINMRERIEEELSDKFPGLGFRLAIPEGIYDRKARLPDEWWVIPLMGTVGGEGGFMCEMPPEGLLLRIKDACEAIEIERPRLSA